MNGWKIKVNLFWEDYYINLYADLSPSQPVLEGVDFDKIGRDQIEWLERPFTEEEVKAALESMEDKKARGPYGFPTKFLKVC